LVTATYDDDTFTYQSSNEREGGVAVKALVARNHGFRVRPAKSPRAVVS
jgi:hypothetical protein